MVNEGVVVVDDVMAAGDEFLNENEEGVVAEEEPISRFNEFNSFCCCATRRFQSFNLSDAA